MTLLIKVFFICISVYAVLSQNTAENSSFQGLAFNERYFNRILKCLLDEGPCDMRGKRLKSLAPYVVRGYCPPCTLIEYDFIKKGISYIQKSNPSKWAEIVKRYAT